MISRSRLLVVLVLGSSATAWLAPRAPDERADFDARVAPVLRVRCFECHSGVEAEGDLRFERFSEAGARLDDLAVWRNVRRQLARGAMPPKKPGAMPRAEVEQVLAWIDALLATHAPKVDPGHTTLRRLNLVEYRNTVRDLVGVDYDAEALFPSDDVGYGFDNIGDVLSMPDVLLEKYVAAAEQIAARAIVVADPLHPPARRFRDDELAHSEKFEAHDGAWSLFTNGFVGGKHEFSAGEYVLRARAWENAAGDAPARLEFRLGERKLAEFDVVAKRGAAALYETRVQVAAGTQRFSAWFTNDFYDPDNKDKARRDRNLHIEWLEVAGPVGFAVPSEFQRRFLATERSRGARELVAELAERAWRRPPTELDLERLCALAPRGATREETLKTTLVALLASPRFLFRFESAPSGAKPGSVRDLDDYELATRLSYFLWSTLPDEKLFELARTQRLHDDGVLASEVRRMLRDPRATALVDNFAGQWLQLRALERASPDPVRFPDFDAELRDAMRAETELLFEAVLREERPLRDLIDPDFTFLNARLAQHYGIEGVQGTHMRRVRLDDVARGVRGGLLQQACMLTVTSNPTRTSPVKRGKWVLETLLASPPLAPQPGVDSLDESPGTEHAASLRERLAQHRADPKCATCHDKLDPLGFALENFDPLGRWREEADGFVVDAGGVLEDGTAFVGSAPLERRLALDPIVARSVFQKLAVYALGRGLRTEDDPAIDAALEALRGNDSTLAELIDAVVQLDAFRKTRVEEKP